MFSQNSVSALATELEKLSRIMGGKDIRTQFKGDRAFTDGKFINVPAMDLTAELDPTHQAIMRGYHIHEVSHVTDTDFGMFQKRGINKIKSIWNCSEDVFVERKAIQKFAGARKNLQETVQHVLANEQQFRKDNPDHPQVKRTRWWSEIPYAALQQARKQMGYESEALDEYLSGLPKELAREARKFAKRMIEADSSEEAVKVARAMKRRMDKLGTPEEEQQEQQQDGGMATSSDDGQQQGDGGDDNTNDETDDDGDEQGDGNRTNDDDSDGDDEGDDGSGSGSGDGDEDTDDDGSDDSGSDGDADGDDGGDGDADEDFDLEAAQNRADEAMQELFGKYNTGTSDINQNLAPIFRTHVEYWDYLHDLYHNTPNTKEARELADVWRQEVIDITARQAAKEHTNDAKRLISDDVRQYSARLARLLLAQEDRRNEGGYASGRIDRRRLSQLVAGNTNVFARPHVTRTSETRIMIAVDGSGSMNASRTRQAILAINSCLGRAGVKFDIVEWTQTTLRRGKGNTARNNTGLIYHKTASDSWRTIDTEFDFQPVGGSTPTYSAILSVSRIMAEWTEPRRICLFVTDGVPNGWTVGEGEAVGEHVSAMRKADIEVYGIGIGTNCNITQKIMTDMFDTHVVHTDFEKLGETMLGGIERLLIAEGHAHAA